MGLFQKTVSKLQKAYFFVSDTFLTFQLLVLLGKMACRCVFEKTVLFSWTIKLKCPLNISVTLQYGERLRDTELFAIGSVTQRPTVFLKCYADGQEGKLNAIGWLRSVFTSTSIMMPLTLSSRSASALPQGTSQDITNFKCQDVSKNEAEIQGCSKKRQKHAQSTE